MPIPEFFNSFKPEDSQEVRRAKELLHYGGHKEGCDKSSDEATEGTQHMCCSCGWCLVADGAEMDLLIHKVTEKGK